jgi:ferrous iron transport protein B
MATKGNYSIGLVGNPNCGKTTLFNALTGSRQRVGNWPGVTVERKSGEFRLGDSRFEVIDLPGTYSLDVVDREVSLDEKVARDYVHANEADLVINIVDASNLERNLYLTCQFAEMRIPLLVVLNMVDVAEKKGMLVDAEALSRQLGCPVIPVVAAEGIGINTLKVAIATAVTEQPRASAVITYEAALEQAITGLAIPLEEQARTRRASLSTSPRWLAVRLLEGDDLARETAGEKLSTSSSPMRITAWPTGSPTPASVTGAATATSPTGSTGWCSTALLGIPIFLLMMYLMFMFTINIGGAFIDFFDRRRGPAGRRLRRTAGGHRHAGMADGAARQGHRRRPADGRHLHPGDRLPLPLPLGARRFRLHGARRLRHGPLHALGRPAGKSFVPLIVGFGCNVPAIMATRTLEHRRDRLMTIAMAPFMSCGARLPVYVLFAAAFFPSDAQNVVFALYLIGIALAVLTGLMLKNSLLKGEATPFIMELPPYHLPTSRVS